MTIREYVNLLWRRKATLEEKLKHNEDYDRMQDLTFRTEKINLLLIKYDPYFAHKNFKPIMGLFMDIDIKNIKTQTKTPDDLINRLQEKRRRTKRKDTHHNLDIAIEEIKKLKRELES